VKRRFADSVLARQLHSRRHLSGGGLSHLPPQC
jgi:hypothetical protein